MQVARIASNICPRRDTNQTNFEDKHCNLQYSPANNCSDSMPSSFPHKDREFAVVVAVVLYSIAYNLYSASVVEIYR